MNIVLNGTSYQTDSDDLYGLIIEKKLDPSTVVIEYNGRIIRKEFWKDHRISENDTIEILNFVGGG